MSILQDFIGNYELSEDNKVKIENIIIRFLVDANCLLSEHELANNNIGKDLCESILFENNFFYTKYNASARLFEISKQFDKKELEIILNG